MIEDGQSYTTLRGVSINGQGEIIDDPERNLRLASVCGSATPGPYTDEMRPFVEQMMHNRICVRVVPAGCVVGITASWAWAGCHQRQHSSNTYRGRDGSE